MGLAVSFSAILFHFASATICTRKWYRVDISQYYSATLHPERKIMLRLCRVLYGDD